MKKFRFIILSILCMLLVIGCSKEEEKKVTKEKENVLTENNTKNLLSGKHKAIIDIIDYGVIEVELDADSAPISVTNFVNLAKDKFYDGLTFHRIISGFVIQGGDPNGDGTGGAKYNIKGEFIDNGVNNELSHTRGALSMARAQDYDSASSQFFICHQDALNLNGQYAVFGYVTKGMEVVDEICSKLSGASEMVAPENQPVIKSITIVDK